MIWTDTETIIFKECLSSKDIPLFRGAIIDKISDGDILFHNHKDDDGFLYSYPLIQYKLLNGHAAVVAIGKGIEAADQIKRQERYNVMIGKKSIELHIDDVRSQSVVIEVDDEKKSYLMHQWLPFNQENYKTFNNLDSLSERYSLLEHILIGNILSLCKGLGIFMTEKITASISQIYDEQEAIFKDVKMNSLDLRFVTNICLPDNIGLGKGASHGFGTIKRK